MINQLYSVTPTKTRQVQFPSTVTVAGTPLLLGDTPCVNLDSYQDTIGGATCYFDGAYSFPVVAASSISPFVGKAINPGDPIYALGGVLDPSTNVTSGFTLCADSGGVLFGTLNSQADPIGSGETDDAAGVDINL
jgi:hypothetical protein